MAPWDSRQYLKYEDHRLRPAIDLIARIEASPAEVWDLGCGTGTITAMLAERWPMATVHGLDSSPQMLERAPSVVGIDWVAGDIATWTAASPVDLLFSNAALQWLDDHAVLFPRIVASVASGGVIAVQMPRNHGAPSHTLLAETARSPRWSARVAHLIRPAPVAEPTFYYDLLRPLLDSIDLWETEYQQVLTGTDPVAEWTKGTAALPFLEALGGDAEAFMADYAARLRDAYPPRPDGTTLFGFKRLFVVGRKK